MRSSSLVGSDIERIDCEYHDEEADAAVGHDVTCNYNREDSVFVTDFFHDPVSDGLGQSGVFHDFAEHGAEQEDREERFNVGYRISHKEFGIGWHDRQSLKKGS